MHLSPGSVWLTVLLGLLVALTPLGTDAYLPTLPAIAETFGAPVSAVQSERFLMRRPGVA